MSDVIDTLAIEIAANDQFTAVAKPLLALLERLEASVDRNTEALDAQSDAFEGVANKTQKLNSQLDKAEKQTKKSNKALIEQEKQVKKVEQVVLGLLKGFSGFVKQLGALGTMIMAGVGLNRLAMEVAQANRELESTAKNLGMSAQSLANWRGVADMSGGSAQGLTGYLNNLSNTLTRFTMQGDQSSVQFFNALGIDMLDASMKARKLEDILFDLADKFSSMDRTQAFSLAQQMGIDEGTFNVLSQGRKALEEHLQKVSRIYKSNQQDLETARKLTAATNYLNQQFEGLKLMIANAVTPVLLKMTESTSRFFDFLQKHEGLVQGVFFGIAGAISAVLIPTLWAGAVAAAAFIAPFLPAILIVVGLALAFGLLYDDYKKWAEGGVSLFNWGNFIEWFKKANVSVDNLKNAFAKLVTGYESWDKAVEAGKAWLKSKGFIDENGVSLDSLANGFKNLVTDIKNAVIPALQRVWEIIQAVLDGEFGKAFDLAKSAAGEAWEFAKEKSKDTVVGDMIEGAKKNLDIVKKFKTDENYKIGNALSDAASNAVNTLGNMGHRVLVKGAEVIDTAVGINPDKDDFSLTQMIKKGTFADAQKGFKKSDSKAGIAEQTLLDEMNKLGYSEQEQAMFLATVQHESNDFKRLREVGGYKSVEQMQKAGIVRAKQDPEGALRAIKQGIDAQFEFMYGGRMGNDQKGDGAKYRGRGAIQITGKDNYRRIGNMLGVDLVKNPELLESDPILAAKASIVWWENKKKESQKFRNAIATGDFKLVTKGVNNGLNGWDDRVARYNKIQSSGMFAKSDAKAKSLPIDPNRPIGGYAVANALQANQHHLSTMQKLAQPQSISNNSKTEIAFNGGIHINSTAGTLRGTAQDLVNGVQNRMNVMQFNTGLV